MIGLLKKLQEKNIIKEEDAIEIESEAKSSKKSEEEIIVAKKKALEKEVFSVKSDLLGIPIKDFEIDEIDSKILGLIPEESAKHYKMIPLKKEGDVLDVGMVFPEDLKAQEILNFLSRQNKFSYNVFLIKLTKFDEAIKQYREIKKEFSSALETLEGELEREANELKNIGYKDSAQALTEEAPVIKMVTVILKYAVDGGASDIHIEPAKDQSRVRFRIDGDLYASIFIPTKIHPFVVARIKILSNLKIDETRTPQDGRFAATIYDKEIDFRVSTFPTSLGEKVVIRVLASEEGTLKLEDLGLDGRNLQMIKEATKKPYGLIFVTGPTGSGKTTTLYSLLSLLNKEQVNIVTLEDPIEYFLKGVNHSQVRPDIGYGFSEGLRSILRQDPDIIMVGEARDEETATLVIHSALTGHIVLSTLHTNNAVGVIPRLVDMGVPSFLIPSALSLATGQRLVGRLCPECKRKKTLTGESRKIIEKELAKIPESSKKEVDLSFSQVYEPVGCKKCKFRGYKGRVGLHEVLVMTNELANLIAKDTSEEAIWKEAERQGMITIKQDGILKILKGITSVEEVLTLEDSN